MDYVAYTISFQTKLKRSDTLFLLPSSAIPAHLAILCYIKKLTSYILLKSLLAAFFLLPLTCHNIQSFKRKQKQERQEPGEKFKKKCDEQSLIPCIYLNHDNKKLLSSD